MFARLSQNLNEFLNVKGISVGSGIFEEGLLKLAEINTKPTLTTFAPIGVDGDRIGFAIGGLSDEDAEKFFAFFKTNGDAKVEKTKREDRYYFSVDADILIKNILPMFRANIIKISEKSPEELNKYIEASKNNENVILCKLPGTFEDILKQAAVLQSSYANTYVGGQLNLLFMQLKDAWDNMREHLAERCDTYARCVDKVNDVSKWFDSLYTENQDLQHDEMAAQFKDKLHTAKDSLLPPHTTLYFPEKRDSFVQGANNNFFRESNNKFFVFNTQSLLEGLKEVQLALRAQDIEKALDSSVEDEQPLTIKSRR